MIKRIILKPYGYFRRVLNWRIDLEQKAIIKIFSTYIAKDSRILDVGCGFGRNMRLLKNSGFMNILGSDINPETVATNRKSGLNCLTSKELNKSKTRFDAVLLSHVVEHFSSGDLLPFVESCLARLNSGGYLIIITPLQSAYFYDDFDHVKPYQPVGLLQVFGGQKAQIQYYGKQTIEPADIWFRRAPLEIRFHRALYFPSGFSIVIHLVNFISYLLFLATGKLLGRTDGWLGIYRKK